MNLAESEVDPEGMKTLMVCISNQENRMKEMQKHLKKKQKKSTKNIQDITYLTPLMIV